jgi:oligoendopeptidase F
MKIEAYKARRFVPAEIDLADTAQLEPLFVKLDAELSEATTEADLERWLEHWSETQAALNQNSSLRYIAMTCQTDDAEREKAYLHIIQVVDPWLKPKVFGLLQKLAAHPAFAALPQYYGVFQRGVATQVKLFREKNVARQTKEAELSQAYQKIIGGMTVTFDGKEQTLVQLGKVQEETDRTRRQAAWELSTQRRLQEAPALEDIYEQLIGLRGEIAQEAGLTDFRAYTFENYERFDYTPQDCLDFHDAIEKHVVPLARELQRDRQRRLGVDRLKPWDLAVDPEQNPPLKPFRDPAELMEKTQAIFSRLDARLGDYFSVLRERELVDLPNRKGKAPGGYQSTLAEARLPFIFMNATGVQRDVETLLHEAGHAFHALAARDQALYAYRGAPIEFCEVASMSMELLAAPYLKEFYDNAEWKRARRDHLEGIIKFFPWMATVDAFQHWVYTHPGHSRDDRKQEWLRLMDRFGGIEDWSGFEEARARTWHRQLHIFEIPFYYVEYGIAQLGALQLWQKSQHDASGAINAYLRGLTLGGSEGLPQLFEATGLRFDFTSRTIEPLMAAVQAELKRLH